MAPASWKYQKFVRLAPPSPNWAPPGVSKPTTGDMSLRTNPTLRLTAEAKLPTKPAKIRPGAAFRCLTQANGTTVKRELRKRMPVGHLFALLPR